MEIERSEGGEGRRERKETKDKKGRRTMGQEGRKIKGEKGEKGVGRELRDQEEDRRGFTARTIVTVVYYSLLTCGRKFWPSPFFVSLLPTTHPSSHSLHPSLG